MKKLLMAGVISSIVLTTGCAMDGYRDPISGEEKLSQNKEKIIDFENRINSERLEKHSIKMEELERTLKEQKVADIKAHLAEMNNPPQLVSFSDSMVDENDTLKRYLQRNGVKFEKGVRSFSLVYDNPVEFDVEKVIIKQEDVPTLQAIVIALLAINDRYPIEVRLHGHADFTGPDSLNENLAKNRAENIKRFLIAQGLPKNMIREVVGHSATQPTRGCVKLQCLRRVEFEIINIEEEGLLMDNDTYYLHKEYKRVN